MVDATKVACDVCLADVAPHTEWDSFEKHRAWVEGRMGGCRRKHWRQISWPLRNIAVFYLYIFNFPICTTIEVNQCSLIELEILSEHWFEAPDTYPRHFLPRLSFWSPMVLGWALVVDRLDLGVDEYGERGYHFCQV